jgi:hypothetical protein
VGLREADRHEAFPGKTRYPAGHYAVIGMGPRSGHVVYGLVERDDEGFARLYCPQANVAYNLGRLGGQALAVRFVAE